MRFSPLCGLAAPRNSHVRVGEDPKLHRKLRRCPRDSRKGYLRSFRSAAKVKRRRSAKGADGAQRRRIDRQHAVVPAKSIHRQQTCDPPSEPQARDAPNGVTQSVPSSVLCPQSAKNRKRVRKKRRRSKGEGGKAVPAVSSKGVCSSREEEAGAEGEAEAAPAAARRRRRKRARRGTGRIDDDVDDVDDGFVIIPLVKMKLTTRSAVNDQV